MKQFVLFIGLLLFFSCSDSNNESYNTGDAQQVYDQMKGTYQGRILVNNISESVRIEIGSDFAIKYLSTYPILSRIFSDAGDLEAAVNSMEKFEFTANTDQMVIGENYTVLQLKPTDLFFSITVDGISHDIIVTFQSNAYRNGRYGDLSVSIYASELYCDGKPYDLTNNGISYIIDNATKDN